jgi:hypothetical protein
MRTIENLLSIKHSTHTLFHSTSCWSVFCRVCIIEIFLQSSEKSKLWRHCDAGWKWEDGEPFTEKNCTEIFTED